jgi:hypothetical protein
MSLIVRPGHKLVEGLLSAWIAAGCASAMSPSGGGSSNDGSGGSGSGGKSSPAATGGTTGTGGAGAGGSIGTGGTGSGAGGSASGGGGGSVTADADSGPTADATQGTTPETGGGKPSDAAPAGGDGAVVPSTTPMTVEGQPKPSYDGEIPIYYGPEVGPVVQMNCPEDPTAGWTEYKDAFHVEHPYTIPTNTRFSITGGIYNHWVFPNDSPHSPTAQGRNPRTESRYGGLYDKAAGSPGSDGKGNFTSGNRLYSADMLIEANAVGSAIMQIHTTATGGGPIGIRINGGNMVNNGSLTVVQGSTVPGGLVGKWFNFKASLNADTLEVKIYINNCLKSTYKGDKGDGHFYFKNGVYFCKTSKDGCFSHYKNIHFYTK